MTMVQIRHVLMVMNKWFVAMPMTVCGCRHRIVRMFVMPVVVAMGMLMF